MKVGIGDEDAQGVGWNPRETELVAVSHQPSAELFCSFVGRHPLRNTRRDVVQRPLPACSVHAFTPTLRNHGRDAFRAQISPQRNHYVSVHCAFVPNPVACERLCRYGPDRPAYGFRCRDRRGLWWSDRSRRRCWCRLCGGSIRVKAVMLGLPLPAKPHTSAAREPVANAAPFVGPAAVCDGTPATKRVLESLRCCAAPNSGLRHCAQTHPACACPNGYGLAQNPSHPQDLWITLWMNRSCAR